jgi:MOSC domain-containing protein YiiM|tara:strand:+ start:773 stop:1264 length:492 start_codon:yes stop_codon:yes gene_type:complete
MSNQSVDLTHLFISPGHNYYGRHGKGSEDHEIVDQDKIELVAERGVLNDRFFDYEEDYKGQVTLFDHTIYEKVMNEFELPDLGPSAFRRNIVVKGVDLNDLIGRIFHLGEIELSGSEEAKPCYWMDEACAPGVEKFLRGHGGLRCRIRQGGTLVKGAHTLKLI